jgi:hypothetical protein
MAGEEVEGEAGRRFHAWYCGDRYEGRWTDLIVRRRLGIYASALWNRVEEN